jgi:hypothetical protein
MEINARSDKVVCGGSYEDEHRGKVRDVVKGSHASAYRAST